MEEHNFTSPWAQSDIIFTIQGKSAHANKTILSLNSPVFERMFSSDFLEKNTTVINLPGKKFKGFIHLMRVVHPPNKEVDGKDNLAVALQNCCIKGATTGERG